MQVASSSLRHQIEWTLQLNASFVGHDFHGIVPRWILLAVSLWKIQLLLDDQYYALEYKLVYLRHESWTPKEEMIET